MAGPPLDRARRAGTHVLRPPPARVGPCYRLTWLPAWASTPAATQSTCCRNGPAVGSAIARWYAQLHEAGEPLTRPSARPAGVRDWYEDLGSAALVAAGERLGLSEQPAWRRALAAVDRLKAAQRDLPRSLLYNDFHHSNLALHDGDRLEAVLFDFGELGAGPTVSDYRNVTSGLEGGARAAFAAGYGPPDDRAVALDAPLALLTALARLDPTAPAPSWARALCQEVTDGRLDRMLGNALARTET